MARGRKPSKATTAVALAEALNFVSLAQKADGATYETHSALWQNWLLGFNGVLSAGCKVTEGDETLTACPHTFKLKAAIDRAGKTLSLTYQEENNRLIVKSDKFKAIVPCVQFSDLSPIVADPPAAIINDSLRKGFEAVGSIAKEKAEHVLGASVLLRAGSVVATDRHLMAEYWHGIDLPTLVLPKTFIAAVLKINKPMLRFGFSDSSATIYFEDESWIKTQLYNEEWPAIDHILNVESAPSNAPKDFAAALETVSKFTDDNIAYFRERVIGSHPSSSEGIEYDCNVPAGLAFNVEKLQYVAEHATKIDFDVHNDPKLSQLVFFGDNVRGTLVGFEYEYKVKQQMPDDGWTTGAQGNEPQMEPNDIEY